MAAGISLLLSLLCFISFVLSTDSFSYIGCYEDAADRAMPSMFTFHEDLTANKCAIQCSGYTYFGLENGNQCFCGDQYNKHGKAPESSCSVGCSGNTDIKCGGFWRLSVYKYEDCFTASATWNGTLAHTVSGKTCQRWDSQSPHPHNLNNSSRFPETTLEKAKNYCRDPDFFGHLWCYTTDPDVRWEICDVTGCDDTTQSQEIPSNFKWVDFYTPVKYEFKFVHPCGVMSLEKESFAFRFTGEGEAHILLAANEGDTSSDVRVIVLGGDINNTRMEIRKSPLGQPVWASYKKNILKAEKFVEYHISWAYGVILVSRGSRKLAEWKDDDPLKVRAVAIATIEGVEGFWQFESCTENVALGKPCTQSSDLETNQGMATNAMDGNRDGNYNRGSCSHTALDASPFWEVDLMDVYRITRINVVNRIDCCSIRLKNLEVLVGPSTDSLTVKATNDTVSPMYNFLFHVPVFGRFVRIQIPGPRYLTLCEVEVYGEALQQIALQNIALHKATSQSSNYTTTTSSDKAVDGDRNNIHSEDSCSTTKFDQNPFWMVNLEGIYDIKYILVVNRGDCCLNRLQGISVYTGETADTMRLLSTSNEIKQQYNFTVSSKTYGQYVRIEIPGPQYLTLCEVEVYGRRPIHYDGPVSSTTTQITNAVAPTDLTTTTAKPDCQDCTKGCCNTDANVRATKSTTDHSHDHIYTHLSVSIVISSVVGGLVVIAILFAILYVFLCRKRSKRHGNGSSSGSRFICTFCIRVQEERPAASTGTASDQITVSYIPESSQVNGLSTRHLPSTYAVTDGTASGNSLPPPYVETDGTASEKFLNCNSKM